jgi:hypothetical protein
LKDVAVDIHVLKRLSWRKMSNVSLAANHLFCSAAIW